MFHRVFKSIAAEYPTIENEHLLMDIGTALIAADPERFDVVVTGNLYGDIISDVSAQVAGSVGLAGSANIGKEVAMFEAIHGSAPDIAGKDLANPSGLLNGAIMMLLYLGQHEIASTIENAWLKTIEEGIHTADIADPERGAKKVSTTEFTNSVIDRLGRTPDAFTPANYPQNNCLKPTHTEFTRFKPEIKKLVGVDIFIEAAAIKPAALAKDLNAIKSPLTLRLIDNRGLEVWPTAPPIVALSDHWRCRFSLNEAFEPINFDAILSLLDEMNKRAFDIIKTENLYTFSGQRGFR